MDQQLSDVPRDLATLTLEVTALVHDPIVLRLSTKFEVRRPSGSEDMTYFRFQHQSAW